MIYSDKQYAISEVSWASYAMHSRRLSLKKPSRPPTKTGCAKSKLMQSEVRSPHWKPSYLITSF